MHNRFEVACRGWLYALPFVLTGPVFFWLLIAPTQMRAWSWTGLIDVYEYGIPIIACSVLTHLLFFLIAGLPFFLVFWERESVIWWFPFSMLLGVFLSALFGLLIGYFREFLDAEVLTIEMGYGAFTALGCWLAYRRATTKRRRRCR